MRHLFLAIFLTVTFSAWAGDDLAQRFAGKTRLRYTVSFNGSKAGFVEWEYLGPVKVGKHAAEVLRIVSDTKILAFFDLNSREKIFLDHRTFLPLEVERDLLVFGNKESITEYYHQDTGAVEIVKSVAGHAATRQVLHRPRPVHNIMALLYFFPADTLLKEGEVLTYNLPTREVKIKVKGETTLIVNGHPRKAVFLEGTGARRFNLWLDREKHIPLRLEFLFPAAKITIEKSE